MENFRSINLVDVIVDLYELLGETKRVASVKLLIFRLMTTTMFLIALTFTTANFFYVGPKLYVQTLQVFLVLSHILLKYLLIIYYKSNIEELFKDIIRRFWNHRDFKKMTQNIEKLYRTVERIEAIAVVVCTSGLLAYYLRPLIKASRGLIMESFLPGSYILDAIILISQFYCVSLAIPIVLGYDFVYFGLCIHIGFQLKLLKQKIKETLKRYDEDVRLEINLCIRHHQFLLTMFARMQKIYSLTLLFHYFGSFVSICSILFEVMLRHTDFINYAAKIVSICALIGQFAIYAFPAEQVAVEFSDIADVIYSSVWYKNSISNQKVCLYAIAAAQKVRYLSGAGIVDINVDAFESVVRKAFSFCAVLRNLINK